MSQHTRYRVTAPLVLAHDEADRTHHHYYGAVISWLSPLERAHLLGQEQVEEIEEPVPPGVVPPAPATPAAPAAEAVRPPQVAPKDVWVDYAVAAHGLDRAAAEAMTKEALKALGH
ncbi:hypothetical protein [Nocardia terpenica]|uniref:Uncharacterized protein n=1 Tax=Nocardia terpenica TaxID=455432 RepID=A0A164JVJ2_9NOCA|nr:hypothetical protein [Nocardia terpenica]KZM70762.1 hypothetical protein AWN90_40085 [Nocardia terpenica]NQE89973.1 hypothetical protein [Nocardia terpenica]